MKFTLAWLAKHLDTKASVAEIADALTALGLEVEGIDDRAAKLAAFTVAEIVEAEPHPDADRLRVCMVNTGTETVQVVCGAPNARAGLKGVFAPPGSYVPGTRRDAWQGQDPRRRIGRDDVLGARARDRPDDHAGIIELAADAHIGAPAADALGLDQPVIDIAVTPNRADCLGIRGIARDLAARGLGTLSPNDTGSGQGHVQEPDRDCPRLPRRQRRLPAFHRALHQGREELREPGLAPEEAHRRGAAPDLGAGGHHQPDADGPLPPAPRVRRRYHRRQPHRAVLACGRDARGPRRAQLRAWRRRRGDRRRGRRTVLGRHHGRRIVGLHRGHGQRAARIRAGSSPPPSPPPGVASASNRTRATASSAASIRRPPRTASRRRRS